MTNKNNINSDMSDEAILAALGKRFAMVRIAAGLTQSDTALEAGVSKRTLERLENGSPVGSDNLVRVMRALGLLGQLDAMMPDHTAGPMALLRGRKERQRVRASTVVRDTQWSWGDE